MSMTTAEAMKRVEELDLQLEMFARWKDPANKVDITEAGHELIAEVETERAELVRKYGN